MNYYIFTEQKNGVEITHYYDSAANAIDALTDCFLSSLDDGNNTGTVFSIREDDTKKRLDG